MLLRILSLVQSLASQGPQHNLEADTALLEGYRPATVVAYLQAIGRFVQWCDENQIAAANSAAELDRLLA